MLQPTSNTAGADAVESFTPCKIISFVLKLIVVIGEITVGSLTLHNNRMDLQSYEKNATIFVYQGNQPFNVTVDTKTFESSLKAYSGIFGIEVLVSIILFVVQGQRVSEGERPIPFLWLPIAIVIEMPLLVSDTYMLKARGIINWHEQFWDLLLHVVFLLNLPIQTLVDIWNENGIEKFSKRFLSPLCFVLGCMIYTPVAITMVGYPGFKIKMEDFGKVIITGETRDILLILAILGRIGQFIWIILLFILFIHCIFKCRYDDY